MTSKNDKAKKRHGGKGKPGKRKPAPSTPLPSGPLPSMVAAILDYEPKPLAAPSRQPALSDLMAILAARADGGADVLDLAVSGLDEVALGLAAFRAVELLLLLCALIGDVGTDEVLQRLAHTVATVESAA